MASQENTPLAAFVPASDPEGARIPVFTAVARIGQGPQNDVVLDDDTVSTEHARLEYADGGWRITDLESKNGTRVDGVRLAPGIPTPLPTNAEVAFGGYRLTFLPEANADPESAAAAPAPAVDRTPIAERTAFRLPVWLVALVILLVALLVTLFLVFGGDPQTADPVVDPVTALLAANLELRAA